MDLIKCRDCKYQYDMHKYLGYDINRCRCGYTYKWSDDLRECADFVLKE